MDTLLKRNTKSIKVISVFYGVRQKTTNLKEFIGWEKIGYNFTVLENKVF